MTQDLTSMFPTTDFNAMPTIPAGVNSQLSSTLAAALGPLQQGVSSIQPSIGTATLQPGYASSTMDLLLQQVKTSQAVVQSKLTGMSQAENDPNFVRSAPNNALQLSLAASNLSLATKATSLTTATSSMSSVSEFLPANIRTSLLNLKALSGSGVDVNALTKQTTINQSTTSGVLADIKGLFSSGIPFATIATMAAAVAAIVLAPGAQNTTIASVLPLPLSQILPNSLTTIYSDPNYLATVTTVAGDGAQNLTSLLTGNAVLLASTPLSNIVNSTTYSSVPIILEDPLGLGTQQALQSDMQSSIVATIQATIETSGLVPNPTDQQTLLSLLSNDVSSNLAKTFNSNLGLPSLSTVARGVVAVSHNDTIKAVVEAHNLFAVEIITNVGVNLPLDGVSPFDHLLNLKNNLESRLTVNKVGVSTAAYTALESYLTSTLIDKDLSTSNLQTLYDKLLVLLQTENG